jgi:hypothetical protein
MTTFTLPTIIAAGVLVVLLALMYAIPRLPFAWQRPMGFLALVLGVGISGALLTVGGMRISAGDGQGAAECFLMVYVLGAATWLAWKEAKPF